MHCRSTLMFFFLLLILTLTACGSDEDTTDGDVTDGDVTDGDVADGDIADGDVADGDITDGDVTDGDVADGDIADGDVTDGDVADGDIADGDVTDGDVTDGDVTDGDVTDGDEVDGDKEEADFGDIWIDETYGLMWQRIISDDTLNYGDAIAYCAELSLADFDDWRLPGIGELRTLVRGCDTMAFDGACNIKEGDCLSNQCKDNDACGDNCTFLQGPGDAGCYAPTTLIDEDTCVGYWSANLAEDNISWSLNFNAAILRAYYHHNLMRIRCVRSLNPVEDGDIVVDGDYPVDGDELIDGDIVVDGDVTDGDVIDGDVTDGDISDGDLTDGDIVDGDVSDGDIVDGDIVVDGDTVDGDVIDGDIVDGDIADGDDMSGQQCDFCEYSTDCAANHACVGYQDGSGNFCVASCTQQSDCDEDFSCQDIGGPSNYCVPTQQTSCIDNDMYSVDTCGKERLLLTCDDATETCNAGTRSCEMIGSQCSECEVTDDCAPDHFCIDISIIDRKVCVKPCQEQSECDNSFNCINIGTPGDFCLPGANVWCENNDLLYIDACGYNTVVESCDDGTQVCNQQEQRCDWTVDGDIDGDGETSPTPIYDIQYTTDAGDGTYPSPLLDQVVQTTGIVTATHFSGYGNNFFISSSDGGAYNGLYVYNADTSPALGDEVIVTGLIVEYFGFTEISNATVSVVSSGNSLPEPTLVSTGDLVSAVNAEAYESVLIKVADASVTQVPDSYNQWYVDDGSGACQIDDGMFRYETPANGDEFDTIIGIVDYNYSEYGLNPRSADDITLSLPEPVVGPLIQNQWNTFTWPYNAYYPEDVDGPNGHYGNACGPTSIARILHYWQYPTNGVGHLQFNDYWGNNWDMDLENLNLDYSAMAATLAPDATEAEYQETAKLFAASGAVGEYTHIWAIGAEGDLPSTFVNYFKFSQNASIVYRENYTRQEWFDIFKAELDAGRPIVVVGRTPDSPAPGESGRVYGHWWVCDGYNDADEFYVDYAFGGIRGYYDIDNLGGIYTAYNRAIIGLEPDLSN